MLKATKESWTSEEENAEAAAPEGKILTAAGTGQWSSVLEQIKMLDREVERNAAARCLMYALQKAPEEVFSALLELLPKGEYAGAVEVKNPQKNLHIEVVGTLVTLAAAQGLTEKLECLLAHGWDVNSASPDAAQCLWQHGRQTAEPFFPVFSSQVEPFTACSESYIRVAAEKEDFVSLVMRNQFQGATPLAAAVLCQELACTRILLEHGAWKEESPVVTRVLMWRDGQENAAFRACRAAVLNHGDAPRPMALWAVVCSAGEEQLEAELDRCSYSEAAIARAVRELVIHYHMTPYRGHWKEERERDFRRLLVLERHYPQVIRHPELAGLLLHWGMAQGMDEEHMEYLIHLCPKQLDLSFLREALVCAPVRKVCRLLRTICQGRTCVMDRDCVPPNTPVMVLQTLMKCVEFLPPASKKSISGLSDAILNSGNLQLIRKALQTGALPAEEPAELMLRCMEDNGCSTMARSLLLTIPRQTAGLWTGHRKVLPGGPMFRWMPPESRAMGYEALLEETCSPELERELIMRGLYDYRVYPAHETEDGGWKMESPLMLLCWTGCRRSVEQWVRCAPEDTLTTHSNIHSAGEGYTLRVTPLCAAAFAGQLDVVETLLRLGADANEQNNSFPSMLILADDAGTLPLTPLLAALVQGHWEVVRALLAHGAVCDLTQVSTQQLWRMFRTEDLHLAAQVLQKPNVYEI